MAMIKCKKCGKEIPDNANFCANCGYQIKKSNKLKIALICTLVLVIVVAIIVVIAVMGRRKEQNSGNINNKEVQVADNEGQEEIPSPIEEGNESQSTDPEIYDNYIADNEQASYSYPLYYYNEEIGESPDRIYRPFSNGRAWVRYKDGTNNTLNNVLAVIDEDGNAVYTISETEILNKGIGATIDNIVTVPFQDGISYFYSINTLYESVNSGFVIIDEDGNELFCDDDGDETTTFWLLGYGEGRFIVYENISTFNKNKDYVFTIDKNGNQIGEKKEVNNETWGSNVSLEEREDPEFWPKSHFYYIGDGLFWSVYYSISLLDYYCIYNMNTNQIIYSSKIEYPLADGVGLVAYNGWNTITRDQMTNQNTWNSFIETLSEGFSIDDYTIGGGLFCRTDDNGSAYYDCYNNYVCSIQNPYENTNVIDIGGFSGDYAGIGLRGADNKYYVTIIDKTGTFQYEPVVSSYGSAVGSYHGYLLIMLQEGEWSVITPECQIKKIGDDLSEMGKDAIIMRPGTTQEILKDGFWFLTLDDSVEYVSLDGKNVINSIIVKQ